MLSRMLTTTFYIYLLIFADQSFRSLSFATCRTLSSRVVDADFTKATSITIASGPKRHTPLFSSTSSSSDTILCELQSFLRLIDVVPTGGAAKQAIQGGECLLNGEVETRRAKKLYPGDIVSFNGSDYDVSDHVALYGYVYKPKAKKIKPLRPKQAKDCPPPASRS